MDLLVLKSSDNYIRVKNDAYQLCGLNKASVFPISQRDLVARHLEKLRGEGFDVPTVARLKIRETPYDIEAEL